MSNPFEPGPSYPPPVPPPYPPPPYPPPYGYGQPAQPTYGRPLPPGTVKNYLIESILVMLCCGAGVFAIPAIIFAAQVDGHLHQGNYQAALDASNNARNWMLIALGLTVVLTLCCTLPICVLYIVGALAGAAH
jgi:hypothetical protein